MSKLKKYWFELVLAAAMLAYGTLAVQPTSLYAGWPEALCPPVCVR